VKIFAHFARFCAKSGFFVDFLHQFCVFGSAVYEFISREINFYLTWDNFLSHII